MQLLRKAETQNALKEIQLVIGDELEISAKKE
jgi:hypothetical protein